jgi:O-acetyl-ADP-ribose deacetylase (regulator of RNase III)
MTSGGRLKARSVIHAVGPVYRDGRRGEAALLASAYRKSLELATAHGIRSLSFPAISAGAYGYPMAEAARIALQTTLEYFGQHQDIALVRFVLFEKPAYATFARVLRELAPGDQEA